MCGLFGWYLKPGEFTTDEKGRMVEVLIKDSTWRGRDSWGIARPTHHGKYEIFKDTGPLDTHKIVSALAQLDTVYGHTRAATHGKVSRANAHPFQVNHIVGAHNGTVHNHDALNKKYRRTCAVDSMHIFYHLSENKTLDELDAWGAFWYFRRNKPGQLYLYKDSLMSLSCYGILSAEKTNIGVVFASSDATAEAAADALGRLNGRFQFYPRQEYFIASWEGLTKTDKQIHFRTLWYRGDNTPHVDSPQRTPFDHKRRDARVGVWPAAQRCTGCGYKFFYVLSTEQGLLCPDCYYNWASTGVIDNATA